MVTGRFSMQSVVAEVPVAAETDGLQTRFPVRESHRTKRTSRSAAAKQSTTVAKVSGRVVSQQPELAYSAPPTRALGGNHGRPTIFSKLSAGIQEISETCGRSSPAATARCRSCIAKPQKHQPVS